jgi:hypothetical protein
MTHLVFLDSVIYECAQCARILNKICSVYWKSKARRPHAIFSCATFNRPIVWLRTQNATFDRPTVMTAYMQFSFA